MRPLVVHTDLGLSKLYRRTGDRVRGSEHLTSAIATYREMDMGLWLEKAEGGAEGAWAEGRAMTLEQAIEYAVATEGQDTKPPIHGGM